VVVDKFGNAYAVGSFFGLSIFGNIELQSPGQGEIFVAKITSGVRFTPVPLLLEKLTDRSARLQFELDDCSGYRLQASINLEDWTTLQTYTGQEGPIVFIDLEARTLNHRFYRIRAN
jgi:hypothetical protein